jgi:hypothetical protein
MTKKPIWNWDEVSQIISDAFYLGKQVERNPDYYSLSSPLSDMKDKILTDKTSQPQASNKTTDTFIDAGGVTWVIKKETLPKKRGVMTYYLAESVVGNGAVKETLKRDLLKKLKEIYGEWEK